MKEKETNNKSTLSEFIRYTRGEMTKREENAFQRKLQQDPFAEEALEGFSEVSPPEAAYDIDRLGKRLINRIRRTQRIIFYRIAASVAVLIIISSVFIIIERNKSVRQLSLGTNPSALKVNDSSRLTDPLVAESSNIIPDSGMVAEQVIKNNLIDTAISSGIRNPASAETAEALAVTEKKDSGLYIAEFISTAPSAAKSEQRSSDLMGRSEILSAEDSVSKRSKAAPGAQNVAPDEIKEESGFTPPSPVDGKENFDKYIEANIRKPASLPQGESAVVDITFTVTGSAVIENIKVISSPAQEFSDEAVRLLKEGPAWNPAKENGKAIAGDGRIRIVFK